MNEKKSQLEKKDGGLSSLFGGIILIFVFILVGALYPLLGIAGEICGLWFATKYRTQKEQAQNIPITPLHKRKLLVTGVIVLIFWNFISISAYKDVQNQKAATAQAEMSEPAPAPKPEAQPEPAPKPEAQPEPAPKPEAQPEPALEEQYTLQHGTLLDANPKGGVNMDTLVIKAKITPSYNNEATIHQNYFNIEDIVRNQGGTEFAAIDYWAVADMTDGSESKVISFLVNSDTINALYNQKIPANQLGDYAEDLYILPSLLE